MNCKSAQHEKIGLLIIAGLAIVALAAIALVALNKAGSVNSESATLVGVVVAGLASFAKDTVQAVRNFWQDDRMGKMTDQIAASAPVSANDPLGSGPTGTPDDPVSVKDAAPTDADAK